MRISLPIADGVTLVLTYDELGYQPVLDTLPDAAWVDVITYNLSENNEILLKKLRELEPDVEVRIITNLPARWKHFKPWATDAKEKFRDMLKAYSAFIDPEKFSPETKSFFNVSNHSKIIMTDKLAYIGSANFSWESQNKYECGFILSKPEAINAVRASVFDVLVERSDPRDVTPIAEAKLFLKNFRVELNDLLRGYWEGLYAPLDDLGEGPKVFRWQDAEVSADFLEKFSELMDQLEEGATAGYEPAKLDELMRSLDLDEIGRLRDLVQDEDEPLHRLAHWNHGESVDRHWQNYAARAYDNLVDHYMEIANNDADQEHKELIEAAAKSHKLLCKSVKIVFDKTGEALKQLDVWEKTNWGVDNT